ncbi:hypothetical protein C8D84_10391 [Psychrobacter immobilis]|uniref:Uncharacterized protein n=2 Tax=Psychrobacter immobilis TaxID=498 RepID=A0A2V2A447_PSYIM|nr:hypothetical protein C8D84_10391 [Psychrobacter immobilis]
MTDYFSFSRFASVALVGSIMTGSLLGCQPNTESDTVVSEEITPVDDHAEHAHEEHEGHDAMEQGHEGHDHAEHASNSTPFSCEPTATIGVSYHDDAALQTVHLLIDGIEYDLTATSDSDASTEKTIYTSDIGLDDTHGIIWQVNGDKATLLNKTLDSNVAIEKEEVLFNCQKS